MHTRWPRGEAATVAFWCSNDGTKHIPLVMTCGSLLPARIRRLARLHSWICDLEEHPSCSCGGRAQVGVVLRTERLALIWWLCGSLSSGGYVPRGRALTMVICFFFHIRPYRTLGRLSRALSRDVLVGGGVLRRRCWSLWSPLRPAVAPSRCIAMASKRSS